ncbi:SDR family oxidoreductase [Actinomycetaceae bacterium MB13-C1-2]|nr:SDR family oxidoreductase [Actinomycetaceae bacterium MB13-C1-2]
MGTALVTGATSGIGLEFCRQLAAQGNNLVLVARDKERLSSAATNFRERYGVRVEVLRADLADEEDLTRVCSRLSIDGSKQMQTIDEGLSVRIADGANSVAKSQDREQSPPVTLLVNAAGFGLGKPFLDDTLEREDYALDVMVRAVMGTCHAAGRAMRERGRGAIINIGSVAADSGMGTYSAHKAWVRSFSEGLAEELRDSGVKVTVVVPGLVRTEFHQRVGADYGLAPSIAWSSPATVVGQSLRAAKEGKIVFVPTLRYKAISSAQRLLPSGLVKAVTRRLPHM